jgi:hypothetical protein
MVFPARNWNRFDSCGTESKPCSCPAVDIGNFSVCDLLRSQQARQPDIEGSSLLDSNCHNFLHRTHPGVVSDVPDDTIQKFLTRTSPTSVRAATRLGAERYQQLGEQSRQECAAHVHSCPACRGRTTDWAGWAKSIGEESHFTH